MAIEVYGVFDARGTIPHVALAGSGPIAVTPRD